MITALIDADIVAYKAAAKAEDSFDFFGDGDPARVVDEKACRKNCDRLIGKYADAVNADKVIICLTDPNVNWRAQLEPTYKQNRAGNVKPELLVLAKEYLAAQYRSFIRPRLEADDIMGILATTDRFISGETIIVSEDKDLRTVPALVYDPKGDQGVMEIDTLDADRLHMYQTITGDVTDGYSGCRGAGPKAAEDILSEDRANLWDYVLFEYNSRGQTEEDALLQARLAHILRATDYNHKTKKVKLWNPLWLL